MSTYKHTLRNRNYRQPVLDWIVKPMFSLIFQSIILTFLAVIGGFLILTTPEPFAGLTSYLPSGHHLTVIRIWILSFGFLYGLIWYVYWWMIRTLNCTNTIKAFPVQILASWLPLIAVVYYSNPVSRPDAMIPPSKAVIILDMSLILIAAILFPLYSIVIYRFVILAESNTGGKCTRLVIVWILFSAACICLLPIVWQVAPRIYHGIEGFPLQ